MNPKKWVTQRWRLYNLFKKRGWVTPVMAFHAKRGLRFSAKNERGIEMDRATEMPELVWVSDSLVVHPNPFDRDPSALAWVIAPKPTDPPAVPYVRADVHQELRLLCEAEVGHACDAECPDWGGPNPCPTGALKAWLSRTEAPKK